MMKKIFILICCTVISCLFFCCSKQTNSDNMIITEIDEEEMAHRNLLYFNLIRESSVDSVRTEYVFKRERDSVIVFITIGLYKSGKDAENIAINYLNSISAHMEEGPHQGVLIGDKFWWWPTSADSNSLKNIVFLRKNALIIMSCSHTYRDLKMLAKSIDDDIVNEESYITFSD
jgi:hypothetical protein